MVKNVVNSIVVETKQKRGRKPKNAAALVTSTENKVLEEPPKILENNNNIIFSIQETKNDNTTDNNENKDDNNEDDHNENEDNVVLSSTQEETKPAGKKRGRKPKGGKIIQQVVPLNNNKEAKPNVILHIKCSIKDLQTNSSLSSNIESFNFSSKNDLNYDIIDSNQNNNIITNNTNQSNNNYTSNNYNSSNLIVNNDNDIDMYDEDYYSKNKENDIRDVWKKLKVLQHNLHINNISNKKSACFWCTYDFDNPPIYIPKHFIKGSYHVYGCFCTPECATAHLMEENIDSSSKFERYHLINNIYSKIYDYKKNIKPAPNPFYLLDKYYGNLSIQEYRSLLRNERLFLVVDKPLTRILPELHEDNEDIVLNIYGGSKSTSTVNNGVYKVKRQSEKPQGPSKTTIMRDKFGLSSAKE
jgi:hypothetical protein